MSPERRSKQKGRRKNYSSRNHHMQEIERKKGKGFRIEYDLENSIADSNPIQGRIEMEQGLDYTVE